MVFTISCSGDDGKDGKDGKSCTFTTTANPDGSLNVLCDGVPSGVLPAGPIGPQGPAGPAGPAGAPPAGYCVLNPTPNPDTGKFGIICGGQEIGDGEIEGSLDGCKIDKQGTNIKDDGTVSGFRVVLVCGTVEVSLCSGRPFDPTTQHCQPRFVQGSASNGSALYPATSYGYGVVELSTCNPPGWAGADITYDARFDFCDDSNASNPKVTPLCGGKYGDPYRGASNYTGSGIEFGASTEFCIEGKVMKRCGTGTTAKNYVIATEFCMNSKSTPPVTADRCGTVGPDGRIKTGRNTISGDRTYAPGQPYALSSSVLIGGEYNTADDERCVDGKVVKVCGTSLYEESTHFCAVGDVVAPHCTDRRIYDPSKQYCSFMGNTYQSSGLTWANGGTGRNIEPWSDNGFYNYQGKNASVCDPNNGAFIEGYTGCLQYASTAVEYCGFVGGTVAGVVQQPTTANTPNMGSWRWEYCRDLNPQTASSTQTLQHTAPLNGSIIRCAELQIPPLTTSSTCICIDNARPISETRNGCMCDTGFEFVEKTSATGRWNLNGAPLTTSTMWQYDGGLCAPRGLGYNTWSSSGCASGILVENSDGTYSCLSNGNCGVTSVAILGDGLAKRTNGTVSGSYGLLTECSTAGTNFANPCPTQSEVDAVCSPAGGGALLVNGTDSQRGIVCLSSTEKAKALYTVVASQGYKCATGKAINFFTGVCE